MRLILLDYCTTRGAALRRPSTKLYKQNQGRKKRKLAQKSEVAISGKKRLFLSVDVELIKRKKPILRHFSTYTALGDCPRFLNPFLRKYTCLHKIFLKKMLKNVRKNEKKAKNTKKNAKSLLLIYFYT